MSDDIVDRLQSPEVFISTGGMYSPVAHEAAAEIARLRAALATARREGMALAVHGRRTASHDQPRNLGSPARPRAGRMKP